MQLLRTSMNKYEYMTISNLIFCYYGTYFCSVLFSCSHVYKPPQWGIGPIIWDKEKAIPYYFDV